MQQHHEFSNDAVFHLEPYFSLIYRKIVCTGNPVLE